MLIDRLQKLDLIHPPSFLADNTVYMTIMGSVAYGCQKEETEDGKASDIDLYGFAIPPKVVVFPHLAGVIRDFGDQGNRFEQWQQHHINDQEARKEYDIQIFSIVKYFQLLMDNNPNIIDSIYTAQDCVQHCSQIGVMVRENRDIFLHKGCWPKFKGYAISQLHKMTTKVPIGKRVEIREEFGFDVKFAYHVVRLLSECEMILTEGSLDLRRNREQLKSIRRGDMTEQQIREWATAKELQLEELYHKSKLPNKPDEARIKQLLLDCLEHHYGNLSSCITNPDAATVALTQIRSILDGLQIP
jgi:predicted nucleotidyltransferase